MQDKLEYKGFVAIGGLNLDILNPNVSWYEVDDYDEDFYSSNYTSELDTSIERAKLDVKSQLSPRLAISHPITENSKLYFNLAIINKCR